MSNEEMMEQLAEVFETTDFTVESKLDELNWDSMGMLTVIAMGKANGKSITGAQLRKATTVGDILALI